MTLCKLLNGPEALFSHAHTVEAAPPSRMGKIQRITLVPKTHFYTCVTLSMTPCLSEPHFPRVRDSEAALVGQCDDMCLFPGYISGGTSGGAGLGHGVTIKPQLQEEG